MVNLGTLEQEIKEAKEKKEAEVVEAQIQVYEGQNYEAREAYEKAKEERAEARRKLPKDIPTDEQYQKQDVQAQYIQTRVSAPVHEKQVQEYRTEIKRQREIAKSVQVLDKELPQLYMSAVKEVETTKEKAKQAKEKVETKYDAIIQTKQETYDKEKARREKQFADVEKTYQETLASNPYTDEARKKRWSELDTRKISKVKFNYDWDKLGQTYDKKAKEAKIEAERDIRYEHLRKDEKEFVQFRWISKSSRKEYNQLNIKEKDARQMPDSRGTWKLATARENYLRGLYDFATYQQVAGGAQRAVIAEQEKQKEIARAKSRAQVAGKVAKDRAHWANVASNPYTSNPNYQPPSFTVGSGTKDDPFRTDYNKGKTAIGETTTPPKEMIAPWLRAYQDQATKYNKAKTGLETTTFKETSTGKDVTSQSLQQIQKQRETELANRRQQQHVAELRAGNIGLGDALMNPQTTQSYTGTSTVNLKTFLKERGYDLNKPEAIPDSVLTAPVKYTEAREQATKAEKENITMGDLRFKEPYYAGFGAQDGKIDFKYKYPEASAETQMLRRQAKERIAQFDPVIPSSDKVQGTKTGFRFTDLKDPQVGTLDSGKPLEQKGVSGFGVTPAQSYLDKVYDYTVPSNQKSVFPLMSGETFEATTPVTFGTKKEAEEYMKKKPKERLFSGTGNEWWDRSFYASAVDAGEVPYPQTLQDKARYYLSTANRPALNIGVQIANIVRPEGDKIPMYAAAEDRLIGGTIEDAAAGTPFKGTGWGDFVQYVQEDPIRGATEIPAAVAGIILPTKPIAYGTKLAAQGGTKLIQTTMASARVPEIIKTGIVGTQYGIGKVQAIPTRIGSSIYQYANVPRSMKYGMPAFTTPQQVVRYGITKPYDAATMFQGSRVGFGAKMNFVLTPSGRMFVREATDVGSTIGARPQFRGKQVVMYETDKLTAFATRGEMKTVEKTLPKEKAFESEIFTPTKKTPLVLKDQPKAPYKFPELYDSKATTTGKPFPDNLVKVEDIPKSSPLLKRPDLGVDRLRYRAIGQSAKDPKKVKTTIDELTFYSETTGDVIKGARPKKAAIQGELDNYKAFADPKITGTREKIQTFKTSTSRTSVKGELKYSDLDAAGKVKLKGKPVREIDTVATSAEVKGAGNLKTIDKLVEKETLEEVGKKTVIKGTDFIAGGKRFNLSQRLESKSATYTQTAKGKFVASDETTLYSVTKKKIPVDKTAFKQTMKESNLLRELGDKAPARKKPKVPEGVPEPEGKYHAFIGESKSVGGKFQGVNIPLGSGIGRAGVAASTGSGAPPTKPAFPVNKFTETKVNLGSGATGKPKVKPVASLPVNKFTGESVDLGRTPAKEISMSEVAEDSSVDIAKWGSVGGGRKSAITDDIDDEIPKGFETTGGDVQSLVKTDTKKITPTKPKQEQVQEQILKQEQVQGVKQGQIGGVKQVQIQTPAQVVIPKKSIKVQPPVPRQQTDQIIVPIQGQKQETGLKIDVIPKQDSVQKIGQVQRVKQLTRAKLDSGLKVKQATGTALRSSVVAKTVQVQDVAFMKPKPRSTPRRKPVAAAWVIDEPQPTPRQRKGKKGKKAGFIGNVRLDSIVGMYKRQEITYGQKKVRKLERQDLKLSSKTPNRISDASGLLKTKKKKKAKTETDLLGRVSLKSKDEFSGFGGTKKKTKKSKVGRPSKKKFSLM